MPACLPAACNYRNMGFGQPLRNEMVWLGNDAYCHVDIPRINALLSGLLCKDACSAVRQIIFLAAILEHILQGHVAVGIPSR